MSLNDALCDQLDRDLADLNDALCDQLDRDLADLPELAATLLRHYHDLVGRGERGERIERGEA